MDVSSTDLNLVQMGICWLLGSLRPYRYGTQVGYMYASVPVCRYQAICMGIGGVFGANFLYI